MVKKHVAFAPGNKWGQAPFCKKEDILIQKMGPGPIYSHGSRLRSPLLRRATVPAQPFSRFFHHTAFAKLGNPTESGRESMSEEKKDSESEMPDKT
jgi:hypothetical protein